MEKQIIFEDDHIRAIHLPGTSATLVISFGDLITRAKGLSINAEKSLQKYDYAVVGIMPKQKSWFPASSMQALMESIRPILAQYQRVVSYGGSMGGYAAIKYSKDLGVQRVIAMVPQYSINPDEVNDRRYTDFFDSELHQSMHIAEQDVSALCEYIVIYDPYYAEDSENFNKIQDVIPQLHCLKLPYTGHDVIAVLANSALLHDFIERDYDETYFYQQMRAVKKNSKFYYRSVIARLLGTHNAALGKILKSQDLQLDGQFFDNQLKQQITRILLTNKRVDEQDLLKLGIQVNLPFEQANQLVDYMGNTLVFNMITQKIEAYPREVVDINGKYIIALYVKDHGLAQVEINKEHYLICMNDRRVTKLFKRSEALSLDMHPIVVKKCEDFYLLCYKNLYLNSDADGNCNFNSESVQEMEKFQIS
ncbi:hypothetical protein RFH42_06835 [Acinetobacter rudis]|uniref:hypothetical protein n=1 Tax=Acinetobacter rudis TaxID=632955 RepID=UPI00280D83D0|nr:hypothetical protein [Acinetobacter rudis]MDQ8952683.1 hypothetical protein [Acinetobacter rudis]